MFQTVVHRFLLIRTEFNFRWAKARNEIIMFVVLGLFRF